MSVINAIPLFLGDEGYQISRSVRLRSSASAYLNRTPSIDGNRKKWTWSGWVKRGTLGAVHHLMGCTSQSGNDGIAALYFQGDQLFTYYDTNTTNPTGAVGPAIYRDPSAWYHIVWAVDAANSIHYVYVNNVLVSTDTSKYPVNYDYAMNRAGYVQRIGTEAWGASNYFDGYLTEVNFIDGQALTPLSFGETNPVTGVWQPKKYAGTYGTNGFYLNFSDNSAATAATIGKDNSGNGNNWTPNNISVTAGVTYDSMLDVPTQWADGGNGRGNYAVSNPINAASGLTVSDGNLKIAASAGGSKFVNSSISFPSSGAYYAEITFANASTNLIGQTIGIALGSRSLTAAYNAAGSYHFYASNTGSLLSNGTETSGLSAISANEVFQVAVDVTNSKMWIGRSNVWYNSTGGTTGNPSTGANPTFTAAFVDFFIFAGFDTTSAVSANFNFGQRPFAYTPPSGFKALNTLNLPTPTILKGNQYFDATTYTGTGAALSVTNSGGMQPDFIWFKKRNAATHHALVDSVRGVDKYLYSSLTIAEETQTTALSSFNANGFSFAGGFGNVNTSGDTYVGWQWKEGATQGFDIVTYTGTGSATTVAHSLGVAPAMIIAKGRGGTSTSWWVYHKSLGTPVLEMNSTAASATYVSVFNNTAPTSSVFSVGTGDTNRSGQTQLAYLFAEVAGFSKFGSYTGNGSADGPFVFCGFRPRWIMWKKTNSATNAPWVIVDTSRSPYNLAREYLLPNASDAETSVDLIDVLSNGFKWRGTAPGGNASGDTYIFAAFAENPLKFSLAR